MSDPTAASAGTAWTPGSYGPLSSEPETDPDAVQAAAAEQTAPETWPEETSTAAEPALPPVRPAPAAAAPAGEAKPAPPPLPPPVRPPPPVYAPPPPVYTPPAPPGPVVRSVASLPPAQAPQPLPPIVVPQGTGGSGSRLEVVNRDGWRKEYQLRRSLAYVGSQPGSDIYLPQPEVAPRHIQFVPSPVNRAGYRLINFSNTPLTMRLRTGEVRAVPPRGAAEVTDGDAVEIAGYSLVFRSGEMQSAAIQARLDLDGTRIELDRPLEGGIYIRNVGDKAGVQFDVQAQGYDMRFLQIEPGPVLFPGVEKRIGFRISHPRRSLPPAGDYSVTFVVTASNVYPGESAVLSAAFTLSPFFAHTVRFIAVAPSMADYTLG